MKVKFKNWSCVVTKGFYGNGGLALKLVDEETKEPIATATVNLEGQAPPAPNGHVFIKDWSENEGMLEALVTAGIVEDTGNTATTGFVEANLCRYIGQ